MTIAEHRGVRRGGRKAHPTHVGALPSTVLTDPTPLIDRERELNTVRTILADESVRLVTLTGPGGVGKTRLALAVARCVESAFPDGVWFVDLAPLHDPAALDLAIARALKLDEAAHPARAEQVTMHLRQRVLLLVLDNFEHFLPAVPRVAALLDAAPQIKVLVTSREPLNLRPEHRVPVAPLTLPDLHEEDPSAIARAPAAALFLAHARRLQPDFTLTPADASSLAALLHRLDGIPLAIQIAAAHSHILSPAAMLTRLEGHALLSAVETEDVPARHQTLRRAMDWSYGLLSTAERTAFRQLSVFVGAWTLEAAEAVLQEREDPSSPVWGLLGRLVDTSLVQVEAIHHGQRYRMLGPIREYALARLAEAGEADRVGQRHAAYYLRLAEQTAPAVFPLFEETAWRPVEDEHENFLAALRWAVGRSESELSVRLAGALVDFWALRGYVGEGRRWLEAVRPLSTEAPPLLRARTLAGEGVLAAFQEDYARAQALLQDAVALIEPLGDPTLTARALSLLGAVVARHGHAGDAQALLERSLALSRQASYAPGSAFALINLGRTFALLEDGERAEAALREGMDLARAAGTPRLTAFALTNLAQLKLRRRDYPAAAHLAVEALQLARAGGYRRIIKQVVGIAALISGHHGDAVLAARLLAAVETWSDWGRVLSPAPDDSEACGSLRVRARREMGEAAYQSAMTEARALSVGQVTELAQTALEVSPSDPRARPLPAGADRQAEPRPLLSHREQHVLRLISEGLPNKQIAAAIGISERTVKGHVSSAMNKLGVDNRAHAAVTAIQRGLL